MEKEAEVRNLIPEAKLGGAAPPPSYGTPPVVVYQPQQGLAEGDRPDDRLIMSILTIFFCFWPLGVVALIKSIETRGHSDRGDLEAARSSSKQALLFNKLSIFVGVIIWVVIFVLQLAWIIPFAVIVSTTATNNN